MQFLINPILCICLHYLKEAQNLTLKIIRLRGSLVVFYGRMTDRYKSYRDEMGRGEQLNRQACDVAMCHCWVVEPKLIERNTAGGWSY